MKAKLKTDVKTTQSKTKPAVSDDAERQKALDAFQESETKFSAAFHSTPNALALARLSDSKFEYVNENFLQLHGYQRAEVLGKTPVELNIFPNPDEVARIRKALTETKFIRDLETTVRRKDGEIRQVLFSVDIIQLNGQPYSLTTMVDITERVRIEKQVLQMKRLYATLIQVNQTIVRVKDRNELYQSICDVAVQFGEFPLAWIGLLDEVTGDINPIKANGMDVAHWAFPLPNLHSGPLMNGLVATAIRNAKVMTSVDIQTDARTQSLREQSQIENFHSAAAIPFSLRGRIIGVLSLISAEVDFFNAEEEMRLLEEMGLDISFALDKMETEMERRQAEDKFQERERTLKLFVEYAPAAIAMLDGDMKYIAASQRYLVDYRLVDQNISGRSHYEIFPETPERWKEIHRRCLADATEKAAEDPFPRADGIVDWVHWEIHPWYKASGEIGGIILFSEVITERKQAEEKLRESQELFRALFNLSPVAYSLARLSDHKIVEVNPACENLFEYTKNEVVGKRTTDLDFWVDQNELQKATEKFKSDGRLHNFEFAYKTKSGVFGWAITSANVIEQAGGKYVISAFVNITERKRAEAQIEYQANLLKHINDAVIAVDNQFHITAWNHAAEIMYGWSAEEALGNLSTNVIWSEMTVEERQEILRQLREFGMYRNEIIQHRKDGQPIYVEASTITLYDKDKQVTGLLSVNRDITERKQAENALRNSQEQMSGIFNSAMDAIISIDTDQRIVIFNPAAEKMFHLSQSEAIGKPLECLIPQRFRTSHASLIQHFAQTGVTNRTMGLLGTIYGLRKDEGEFPIEASISKTDLSGKELLTVILRDITERKRAEAKIQQQLEHLNSLRAIDTAISSSFDIHVTLDIVLQQVLAQLGVDAAAILLLNPQLQKIEYAASRGFRSNALQHTQLQLNEGYAGRAVHERKTIYIPALLKADGKLAEVMRSAQEEFVDYYGTPLISKDGIKGVLEIYHRSALHPDPEWLVFLETLAGQAAIAIDNAQLFDGLQRANAELEQRVAQRTAELNQTNVELEHANRAKDEFLATMSHELRTPLNSILGLSETLLEQRHDPLSEYQQRYLRTIEASGSHLLELINDILDLSKIDAGKFDYYPQLIGVDDLCRSSLTFVKEQATRKSITLTYQLETTVSKMYADPRRLKQILINLLTNAVKFTPEHGQVILQVAADAEQERIQFSVIDNGIGIAPENLKKLFQPFVQIDSRLTREYEGSGLGLALVQKLTDLQGGSVDVESEVGQGSRFTINLPVGQALPDEPPVQASGSKLPIREQAEKGNTSTSEPADRAVVLLAEDNTANILTIGDYLESHGYQLVVAHDGLEAIEKAEALQPNIILMDIQMPALDGLEAIRRLRADSRFASTPIIALTALAMPGDRERCLEAGANEYMSKPISLKTMLNTIEKLSGYKK